MDSLNGDILTEIFYCSENERPLSRFIDPHEFPPMEVTVSHVSRRWRALALSLATLWSKILVAQQTTRTKFPLDMAWEYLRRCGAARLVARVELDNAPSAQFSQVFSLLLSKVGNLSWLSIRFSRFEGLEVDVFEALQSAVPQTLEYLSITSDICVPYEPRDSVGSSLDRLFPALFSEQGSCRSCLRTLRLSGRALSFQPPLLHTVATLHLEQCLGGRVFDWLGLHHLLAQCPQLENLSVEGTILTGRDWLHSSPPTILLPSLRRLRLHGITGEIYSGLLLAISAPRLEALFLRTPMLPDLGRFLTDHARLSTPPKFPCLESIAIDGSEFDVHTWELWLSVFPTIKHITVFDSTLKTLVILGLLSGEIDSWNSTLSPGFIPCPKLESLTVLLN